MTVQADHGFVYPTWTFGDRIRKARIDVADMNQRDFAAAISATEGSLATWETGRAKPRDIVAVAKRVEMATRIPASWLLGIDDGAPSPGGPDGGTPQGKRPRQDLNLRPRDYWGDVRALPVPPFRPADDLDLDDDEVAA